jgi:hypothetical protein
MSTARPASGISSSSWASLSCSHSGRPRARREFVAISVFTTPRHDHDDPDLRRMGAQVFDERLGEALDGELRRAVSGDRRAGACGGGRISTRPAS